MTDVTTWRERTSLNGDVDFTMMYAAHDAFTRDLRRMVSAGRTRLAFTPETRAGWATFTNFLHIHHRAEDTSLWPRLRARAVRSDEVSIIDMMEMEHAQIDPHLERVEEAFAATDAVRLAEGVQALTAGLTAHMRHEEEKALPLVEAHLGREGWAAFGREIRKMQGLRAGAQYLPWLLDGAPDATQTQVLRLLPPPVRFLYRRIWAPRYRRTPRWNDPAGAQP